MIFREDIVFTIIAFLISALVWRGDGRRTGLMVLLFQLMLIGLGQISVDLGLASVLVGVPLWLRDSRKVRVTCAAILLVFQFALLGPTFMVSRRVINEKVYQTEDRQTSYRQAYWDGVRAMHEHLEKVMVQPIALYTIALAILVFVPYRKQEEESQQTSAGDVANRAAPAK
jgi:hypothetical protein